MRSESLNVVCLVLKLFRNCAILKLQPAPQIVQPKGRICLHVLHALHHLLMPKTCLQVQVMYCMISFWIQKLIMHCMTWRFQASWLSRLAGQERKVESKRWSMPSRCCCIYMAYKKMPVERPSKKIRKEAKIYCLNTLMPFLGPMYPMLGVQSGLCFHSNPTDQFLSEPLGRRLLLEIEISG